MSYTCTVDEQVNRGRHERVATAARVTGKGDVPVLVVKLKPTQAYRRPLITTDLGNVSHRTFELVADLIAIGTHGRAGIAHFLLGSVAEWVLTSAPCDVLVARPIRFSFKLP